MGTNSNIKIYLKIFTATRFSLMEGTKRILIDCIRQNLCRTSNGGIRIQWLLVAVIQIGHKSKFVPWIFEFRIFRHSPAEKGARFSIP